MGLLDETVAEVSEAVGAEIPAEDSERFPERGKHDSDNSIRLEFQSFGPGAYQFHAQVNRADEHAIGIGRGSELLYGIQVRNGGLTIYDSAGRLLYTVNL